MSLVTAGLALIFLAACLPMKPGNIAREMQQPEGANGYKAFSSLAQPEPTPQFPIGNEEDESNVTEENEQILFIEEIIIGMLFVAVLVGIAAHRLRVPYTIGLVLIGLVLTLSSQLEVTIPPNLILALLVPPLIFEAAFHLNLNDLRQNLAPILILAIPGVLLTTVLVGAIVAWGTGLPFTVTLVFGALVAATDPVSVVALFRTMGVPKRLQVLLEGESLLNDGTAIVIFNLVVAYAVSTTGAFRWVSGPIDFLRVTGGGVAVGLVLGALVSQLITRIDDYLIETTLTSVLAYGAYLIAEIMGVSGVLAVVAAGLINGNIGPQGMSPTTRIVVFNFWEYAGFLANTFIFLLIGLRIDLGLLFNNLELILWAVGSVLLARAIGVYGLSWVGQKIPMKWKHVLYWGGLRGAISLALALSLPFELEARDQIQVMAFGVVLFTLLVQGFTMKTLVRRLKITQRTEAQDEYERRHARAVANRTAYEYLRRRHHQGLLSDHAWKTIAPILEEHNQSLADAVRDFVSSHPDLEAEEMDTARREALRAQRSAISSLLKDGVISEDNYSQLASEVDAALLQSRVGWQELMGDFNSSKSPIDRLMAVVIQENDIENATSALTKLGIAITTINSTGGFLNRRSATMLIGLNEGQEEIIYHALEVSCRRRVEYLSNPMEGSSAPVLTPVPVTVGGATIFTFKVERYEAF